MYKIQEREMRGIITVIEKTGRLHRRRQQHINGTQSQHTRYHTNHSSGYLYHDNAGRPHQSDNYFRPVIEKAERQGRGNGAFHQDPA